MLNIYIGDVENEIYNTSMYFDHTFLDSWFDDELSQKIIKAVDKAKIIGNRIVDSAALGPIPVTQLSGGTKTLLLLRHDKKHIFNASTCGDNCAKWILRVAKESKEDVNITLHHLMDFGDGRFEVRIMNNNTIVHDMTEFVLCAGNLLRGEE
jgi:hypothetical protein